MDDGGGDMEMADRCFTIDWKSHVLTMMDFQLEKGSVCHFGGRADGETVCLFSKLNSY